MFPWVIFCLQYVNVEQANTHILARLSLCHYITASYMLVVFCVHCGAGP